MKLYNGIIRPGRVLQVLEDGKIKVSAPGLFSEQDSTDLLPPIYPWPGSQINSFSSVEFGDEVWVVNFSDNPIELFWFRKDNIKVNDKEILQEENVEILCNRETTNNEWATIYFSDNSGWVISKGKNIIQIRPDGSIKLSMDMPHRTIDISSDSISLGTEGGSEYSAVRGENLLDVLNSLMSTLSMMSQTMKSIPMLAATCLSIDTGLQILQLKMKDLLSPHVTLD